MSTFNNNNFNTTAGPHGSDALNKADPRVDSDLDHRGAPGTTTGLSSSTHTGAHTGTSGLGSSAHTGTAGAGYTSGPAPNTDGPHKNDFLNKADPRVDSDRSNLENAYGSNGHQGPSGVHSSTHGTSGLGSSTHGSSGLGSNTHGTATTAHKSNLADKLDPRVDSDRDHRADPTIGSSTHGEGFASGRHNNDLLNKADPRVDSDRDHRGAHHDTTGHRSENIGSHTGEGFGSSNTHSPTTHTGTHNTHSPTTGALGNNLPGPAAKTAGPHKSDLLNKLDPRVDSDLDGSKTVGGNKTYST